jgi:hypothetical protein
MTRALPTRAAVALVASAAVALLACGCGGGRAATSSAAAARTGGALAYSRCMRSHGLPSFPDPDSSGSIPKAKVAALAGSPKFAGAQGACGHLLPNLGEPTDTHAEVEAALNGMVQFAACMRSRGVQSWPDPGVDRDHPNDPRPVFDLHSLVDPDAPRIRTDMRDCQHLMPQSTSPYICSRVLAERIPGSPPGAEACGGGSATVP